MDETGSIQTDDQLCSDGLGSHQVITLKFNYYDGSMDQFELSIVHLLKFGFFQEMMSLLHLNNDSILPIPFHYFAKSHLVAILTGTWSNLNHLGAFLDYLTCAEWLDDLVTPSHRVLVYQLLDRFRSHEMTQILAHIEKLNLHCDKFHSLFQAVIFNCPPHSLLDWMQEYRSILSEFGILSPSLLSRYVGRYLTDNFNNEIRQTIIEFYSKLPKNENTIEPYLKTTSIAPSIYVFRRVFAYKQPKLTHTFLNDVIFDPIDSVEMIFLRLTNLGSFVQFYEARWLSYTQDPRWILCSDSKYYKIASFGFSRYEIETMLKYFSLNTEDDFYYTTICQTMGKYRYADFFESIDYAYRHDPTGPQWKYPPPDGTPPWIDPMYLNGCQHRYKITLRAHEQGGV